MDESEPNKEFCFENIFITNNSIMSCSVGDLELIQ